MGPSRVLASARDRAIHSYSAASHLVSYSTDLYSLIAHPAPVLRILRFDFAEYHFYRLSGEGMYIKV